MQTEQAYAIAAFIPPEIRRKVAQHQFRYRWHNIHRTRRVDANGCCPLGYAAKLMRLDCPEVPEGRQFYAAMLDSSWRDDLLADESITMERYGELLDELNAAADAFANDWDRGRIADLRAALGV